MRLAAIVFSVITVMTGCVSIKETARNDIRPLNNLGLSALNGTYSNMPPDSSDKRYRFDFWNGLAAVRKDTAKYNGSIVQLEVKNEKRIHARVTRDNQFIKEYTIKGKVENNYFVAKRRIKMFGFPLVFFLSSDIKYRFGLDNSDNLIVDAGYTQVGMCVFMVAGNTSHASVAYKKK